jgi:hypothetical protein
MTWKHILGGILAAAGHHLLITALIIVVIAGGLWLKKRTGYTAEGPVVVHDIPVLPLTVAAGIAGYVLWNYRHAAPAKAAPAKVTHTTIVQHVTHVTQHVTNTPLLAGGNLVWVVLGGGALLLAGFLNSRRSQ